MKEILYSCGHVGTDLSAGKARIEWLEQQGLCPECYKAQQREQTEEVNEGLPELQGSEKQIAWAKSIRGKFYKVSLDYLATLEYHKRHSPEKCAAEREKMMQIICQKTEAKWWIENRRALENAVYTMEQRTRALG